MEILSLLKSGSSLDSRVFNRKLLDVLSNGDEAQEDVIVNMINNGPANDNRMEKIIEGEDNLSLQDIIQILETLEQQGLSIDPEKMDIEYSPFSQQAFYDALHKNEYAERILAELEVLRDHVKSERGFLKTTFNLWAAEKPLETIASNALEFELFCQENNISFSEAAQQLGIRQTKWDKIKKHKFLIAAAAGTLAGLAGFDPSVLPVLSKVPGLFFTALPYFAVPFIGLNVFKAFSNRKLSEEAGTFLRFTGIMMVGVTIGLAATSLMAGSLGTLDTQTVSEQTQTAATMMNGGFLLNGLDNMIANFTSRAGEHSPGKVLLPVIGGAFGLSGLYKLARDRGANATNDVIRGLSRAATGTGNGVGKFAGYFDKAFMGFINGFGAPSIFLLLAATMAQSGFDQFSNYAGYYATVGLAMAGCAGFIGAAAYAYGLRKEGFKHLIHTFSTAFSLSSSSATMPVTKKALEEIGVSEKVRNSVVPLGATFNMMGTALYLGMTAVCASTMLGNDPTLFQQASVMATAIATAFGAPGIPASSIAFMTPVLETLSMSPQQMSAVFAMILLMDRPFDMLQTGLNVTGDMIVALDTEADAKGGGVKNKVVRLFNKLTGRDTEQETPEEEPPPIEEEEIENSQEQQPRTHDDNSPGEPFNGPMP